MLCCWQETVTKRPAFAALQAKFECMLASEGAAYIDFSINPEMQYYKEEPDENQDTSDNTHIPPSNIGSAEPGLLDLSSSETRDSNLPGITAGGHTPIRKGNSLHSGPLTIPSTISPCESKRSSLCISITGVLSHTEVNQQHYEERYVDNPSAVLASPKSLKEIGACHDNAGTVEFITGSHLGEHFCDCVASQT